MSTGYDIIGDIHGHAKKLRALFAKLGYQKSGLTYSPPIGRTAIFLGDFIDRGSEQAETLQIVRSMTETGDALSVQGNHEYNAVSYATTAEGGDYLRPHTERNKDMHGAFLNEFPFESKEYNSAIDWFKTLPLYLKLDDFQVIHACWHQESLGIISPYLNEDHTLKKSGYGLERGCPEHLTLETLLKGPEYDLPKGCSFLDAHGIERSKSRFHWWSSKKPHERLMGLGDLVLTQSQKKEIDSGPLVDYFNASALDKPLFVGHYYMEGEPSLSPCLERKVVCLDFQRYLTAYQWDNNSPEISSDRLVYVS